MTLTVGGGPFGQRPTGRFDFDPPARITFVEQQGATPVVGAQIWIDGHAGPFVVVKVARSPLPADRRRCAYLEPAPHIAA